MTAIGGKVVLCFLTKLLAQAITQRGIIVYAARIDIRVAGIITYALRFAVSTARINGRASEGRCLYQGGQHLAAGVGWFQEQDRTNKSAEQ